MLNRVGYSSKYLRENHSDKILNTLKNRFYQKVLLPNENGCMEWTGTKIKGYGIIYIKNRNIRAHRFSFTFHIGNIPKGKILLHTCDNPSCINPEHLKIGTQQDNMNDCKNKDRYYKIPSRRGEENNKTKLTKDKVIEIRFLLKNGYRKKDIAKKYSVTSENIRCIELNKTWRHI